MSAVMKSLISIGCRRGLPAVAVIAVLCFLIARIAFWASLETVRTASPCDDRSTPPLDSDTSWADYNEEAFPEGHKAVQVSSEHLLGNCFPTAPTQSPEIGAEQNGFRELYHRLYQERNLFTNAGLNFEHIMSGLKEDSVRNSFSPRKEPCVLRVSSEQTVSLYWPAEGSLWNAASEMTYTLGDGPYIDLMFKTTFEKSPERRYLLYMWASYMKSTRDHRIRFFGVRDFLKISPQRHKADIRWVDFGERVRCGGTHEDSNIPYWGASKLSCSDSANGFNIQTPERCAFLLPFFYGLVDGDGDLATSNDDMVYLMMFDQAEAIRFTTFDFSGDVHQPVWDWQYVIRYPRAGHTYQYRARLVYKPYKGVQDVVEEYVAWVKALEPPSFPLDIDVEPAGSGSIFPENMGGMYGDNVKAYFGVNPAPGWTFDHWEGPVQDTLMRYTGTRMNAPTRIRAVCVRRK